MPVGCPYVLAPNQHGHSLQSQMARQFLATGDPKWHRRAENTGERAATYPRTFDWELLSTGQRKFLIYCFVNNSEDGIHSVRVLNMVGTNPPRF